MPCRARIGPPPGALCSLFEGLAARFGEQVRRAIFFARDEAAQMGSTDIGPGHLLIGILREDKTLAVRFMGGTKAIEAVRAEIEKQRTPHSGAPASVDLPIGGQAQVVLREALQKARQLGHGESRPEHVLLAPLSHSGNPAAQVLAPLGVTAEAVRTKLAGPV